MEAMKRGGDGGLGGLGGRRGGVDGEGGEGGGGGWGMWSGCRRERGVDLAVVDVGAAAAQVGCAGFEEEAWGEWVLGGTFLGGGGGLESGGCWCG